MDFSDTVEQINLVLVLRTVTCVHLQTNFCSWIMHGTYTSFILAVDLCSLLHKILHNIALATLGCIV